VNGPFVQYFLTFRSVDKGNDEEERSENAMLVGRNSSKMIETTC
jgi:hypothetical protein